MQLGGLKFQVDPDATGRKLSVHCLPYGYEQHLDNPAQLEELARFLSAEAEKWRKELTPRPAPGKVREKVLTEALDGFQVTKRTRRN